MHYYLETNPDLTVNQIAANVKRQQKASTKIKKKDPLNQVKAC